MTDYPQEPVELDDVTQPLGPALRRAAEEITGGVLRPTSLGFRPERDWPPDDDGSALPSIPVRVMPQTFEVPFRLLDDYMGSMDQIIMADLVAATQRGMNALFGPPVGWVEPPPDPFNLPTHGPTWPLWARQRRTWTRLVAAALDSGLSLKIVQLHKPDLDTHDTDCQSPDHDSEYGNTWPCDTVQILLNHYQIEMPHG